MLGSGNMDQALCDTWGLGSGRGTRGLENCCFLITLNIIIVGMNGPNINSITNANAILLMSANAISMNYLKPIIQVTNSF